MIQKFTRVNIADNSGAKVGLCIGILGGTRKNVARIGDVIVIAVKSAIPDGQIKTGDVATAVVIRTRSRFRRKNGEYLQFGDNAVVCLQNANSKEIKGTRIFGPVSRELLSKGYNKIVSLAKEVV